VSALREAFEALNLHPRTFTFRELDSHERSTGKTHGETFNDVLAKAGRRMESREKDHPQGHYADP
jgi:hypothetical protein